MQLVVCPLLAERGCHFFLQVKNYIQLGTKIAGHVTGRSNLLKAKINPAQSGVCVSAVAGLRVTPGGLFITKKPRRSEAFNPFYSGAFSWGEK